MDVLVGMIISFSALILGIYTRTFIGFPLLFCFLSFGVIAWKRGYSLAAIIRMSYQGSKKAFIVLKVFVLIGGITGIWMAAGTVPGIVYYGIRFMNPKFFILSAFLISALVSSLLGTSLGTVGTVGMALIVMAKSGNVNVDIAAGAVIAGAYFGDRCSPMSSSANLVAHLTETELYGNIRNMLRTSIIPFILSIFLYAIVSIQQPISFSGNGIGEEILQEFHISWVVLLPAGMILILSILRVDVKISMVISIIGAAVISGIFQQNKLHEIIRYMFMGFQLDEISPLYRIIKGGGILSMWKASLVVLISCALAGIFNETAMLKYIENIVSRAKSRFEVFVATTLVSIATAAFGCNQSIAIVLTSQFMKKNYENQGISHGQLAVDVENTAVLIAALIPWNIAAFVPTTTMGVGNTGYIPYAFYLYLVPVVNMVLLRFSEKQRRNPAV